MILSGLNSKFKRPKFKKDSTENYNQDSDVGYFFEVDDPYLWKIMGT